MSDQWNNSTLAPDAAAGRRFAVVVSRFNEQITARLRDGAVQALSRHGAVDVEVVTVPGAFELSMGAAALAARGEWAGIVCVGALIRGETPHFDVLAAAAAHAIQAVSLRYGVPIGFGLITCDTPEQAEARAGGDHGNKGVEAALAVLEMAGVYAALEA